MALAVGTKAPDFSLPDVTTGRMISLDTFADKKALLRIVKEQEKQSGFVPDPTATAERAQQMSLADGLRPEECSGSREIIRMREE